MKIIIIYMNLIICIWRWSKRIFRSWTSEDNKWTECIRIMGIGWNEFSIPMMTRIKELSQLTECVEDAIEANLY